MLATLDDLKRRVRTAGTVNPGAAIDEATLAELLAAASARIAEACSARTLEPVPADPDDDPVELVFPVTPGTSIVEVPDLRTIASATLNGEDVDTTQWARRPLHPRDLCAVWITLGSPAYSVRSNGTCELRIVGHWGPAGAKVGTPADELAVRDDIRDAVLVWAARAWHHRTARYADNVQTPDGGMVGFFRNVPADVNTVINSLVIPGL